MLFHPRLVHLPAHGARVQDYCERLTFKRSVLGQIGTATSLNRFPGDTFCFALCLCDDI